jgi:OOP family OmpA-OmpF porin
MQLSSWEVAAILRERGVTAARIEGHTDARGSPSHNQELSERRAAAVYNWLVELEALRNVKFMPQGFGATRPVAPNIRPNGSDDPKGRAKNRRVKIVFDTR